MLAYGRKTKKSLRRTTDIALPACNYGNNAGVTFFWVTGAGRLSLVHDQVHAVHPAGRPTKHHQESGTRQLCGERPGFRYRVRRVQRGRNQRSAHAWEGRVLGRRCLA